MQAGVRFILAFLVLAAHLGGPGYETSSMGRPSVFCFYMLSGWLITRVLHESYRFRAAPFILNRMLRLWPAYLLILGATVFLLAVLPGMSAWKPGAWEHATGFGPVAVNLALLPLALEREGLRLVPPAWSIGVEVICYIILLVFAARSRSCALVSLCAGLGWYAFTYAAGLGVNSRYFPVAIALVPFSIGPLIYFETDRIVNLVKRLPSLGASGPGAMMLTFFIVLWAGNLVLTPNWVGHPWYGAAFATNTLLFAGVVAMLALPEFDFRPNGLLKLAGDISFPLFLCHWQVGYLVSYTLLEEASPSPRLLALSIVPSILVAIAVSMATDRFVEPLRNAVRADPRQPAA